MLPARRDGDDIGQTIGHSALAMLGSAPSRYKSIRIQGQTVLGTARDSDDVGQAVRNIRLHEGVIAPCADRTTRQKHHAMF